MKKRVMVADDNEQFLELLDAYFRRQEDMELVYKASNGLEAIEALKQHEVDVLILDIIMPGMDGLEVRYATYTPQWEEWAEALCRERGLLPSGGSDFHGARKKNDLGTGLGDLRVPEGFYAALAEAARQRRRGGKRD